MILEDDLLVRKCLGGEKDAFGVLVDKYKDAVCGLAYSKVRNFHDAQDIAQEAFIDAYRNLRSLKYPHRFRSWIYTIVVNQCRMWLRKQPQAALAFGSVANSKTEAGLQDQAIQQDRSGQILDGVLDAINELPEATRLVMTLYYIDGLTCKEIGEFTGTSINTVMSKLRRAREKLRREFTEMPAQTITQQRVSSGFTTGILGSIEHISPSPPPSSSISRITRVPWAVGLIIGLIIIGAASVSPPDNLYGIRESEELVAVYPVPDDESSILGQIEGVSPANPSAQSDGVFYATAKGSETKSDDGQGGGIQCRLSPGDILTYRVHRDAFEGGALHHTTDGTRSLLVTGVKGEKMRLIKVNRESISMSDGQKVSSYGELGFMYINRDGSAGSTFEVEGPMFFQSEEQHFGGDFYFIRFPSGPLKQGDTWVDDQHMDKGNKPAPATYTVTGFEEVKGYPCVILDREQTYHVFGREIKSRIACDVNTGVIVKFDSEVRTRKTAEQGDEVSEDSILRLTAELAEKELLDQEALALEKRAFDEVESAYEAHRMIEPEELLPKLEKIREQYPETRLMPGIMAMIQQAKGTIASRTKDAKDIK